MNLKLNRHSNCCSTLLLFNLTAINLAADFIGRFNLVYIHIYIYKIYTLDWTCRYTSAAKFISSKAEQQKRGTSVTVTIQLQIHLGVTYGSFRMGRSARLPFADYYMHPRDGVCPKMAQVM